MRSYQQDGRLVETIDHTARIKSAELLLAHGVGKPVERMHTITARVPTEAVDRVALRGTIERKLAALVDRPGITMDELLQARRILSEVEKATSEETKPLSEEAWVAASRKVHAGGGPPDAAPSPEDLLKELDQKIASLTAARTALGGENNGTP
jgi:hypothetical protein